jgi:glycosyltransferase involved in cell wall biosynthesis
MKTRSPRISCVIPAYNEERWIGTVLKCVSSCRDLGIDEIIVVDDGSYDHTRDIVRMFPAVRLIAHGVNRGKSASVARGLRAAHGQYILTLDADLFGLSKQDIRDLIAPVVSGYADMSISSKRETAPWWLRYIKAETLSGDRCFPHSLVHARIDEISTLRGYGFEVFLNGIAVERGLGICTVPWPNVAIVHKWEKSDMLSGAWQEVLMWRDIFSVVGPHELAAQVLAMRELSRD